MKAIYVGNINLLHEFLFSGLLILIGMIGGAVGMWALLT